MISDIEIDGKVSSVDLTQIIGYFKPELLVYFCNIQEIKISGCPEIPCATFVDCIVSCSQLKKIEMTGCIQFTEKMLVKMFNKLLALQYIDCSFCAGVTFASAFNIVSHLHDLFMISLEPKFRGAEMTDWKRLIVTFTNVKFGVSILSVFPNYGQSLRLGLDDFSVEE